MSILSIFLDLVEITKSWFKEVESAIANKNRSVVETKLTSIYFCYKISISLKYQII